MKETDETWACVVNAYCPLSHEDMKYMYLGWTCIDITWTLLSKYMLREMYLLYHAARDGTNLFETDQTF